MGASGNGFPTSFPSMKTLTLRITRALNGWLVENDRLEEFPVTGPRPGPDQHVFSSKESLGRGIEEIVSRLEIAGTGARGPTV